MKGPGIKDYLEILEKKKQDAAKAGLKTIEISSKGLHAEVSPNHATMPTCCQAMYKLALTGDEILRRPKGQTGFGSHLVILYRTDELDSRERLFPSKKRGRPSKSPEEKALAKKQKMKRSTEDLSKLIRSWLDEHGWDYTEIKNEILAQHENERWVINVQGIKRGRKQTLPSKVTELITKIQDPSIHYSLAFNDSPMTRRQWNEISPVVKKQLKLSVLLADKQGNIREL